MDNETFKNIIMYIYKEKIKYKDDSMRDIINEALQSENVMFYLNEDDEIIET